MNSSIRFIDRKQNASFRIVLSIVIIAPLWLMLAAASTSAYGQIPDDVSNSSAATSSPADWTQFLRDNMQRWNPYETVLGVGSVGSLKLKWETALACHSGTADLSSPAVVNGVVYFGCSDSAYALNASTGAKLWSFTTPDFVQSSPAVANGVVYINSYYGNLYALNANTGAKLWSYPTFSYPMSAPVVVNGVVYVGEAGALYALNANTGALLWTFTEPNPGPGAIEVFSPAVAKGVVYVTSEDGVLSALNAATGAVLWTYAAGSVAVSSPAVANGVVYVGLDHFYALNASTGARLWSNATIHGEFSAPAVANGVVYVWGFDSTTNEGTLFAVNASTGARLWSYSTGASTSPAVANGVVYIGTNLGGKLNALNALNASTGATLWSYPAVNNFSSVSVVDGVVYVQAQINVSGSEMYAFSVGADLFLRIIPSSTTVHRGDLLTFAFPVWNLGPDVSEGEVLNTQVPEGTTFDYIRISGTPGLGTCTTPPYQGTGQIVCHENAAMAANTTWTVRLTVKVTAPAGTTITENAATMADTFDPNMTNNMATATVKVQ